MVDRLPETPEEFEAQPCDRCGKNAHMLYDQNVVLITVQSPGMNGDCKHILCGPCSILWQEWACMSLMKDAEYVAMRDQIMADYREAGWIDADHT